jgi:hypothetical protein
VLAANGSIDESSNYLESRNVMLAYDVQHPLPSNALFGEEAIYTAFKALEV